MHLIVDLNSIYVYFFKIAKKNKDYLFDTYNTFKSRVIFMKLSVLHKHFDLVLIFQTVCISVNAVYGYIVCSYNMHLLYHFHGFERIN